MPLRHMTTEEFIEKANKKHEGRYDYASTVYTNSKSKVVIICREHGSFEMVAFRHSAGANCKKCSLLSRASKRTCTFSEVVSKAHTIHNSKYTYSSVGYVNAHSYLSITCPEHGVFKQKVHNHLNKQGCPLCSNKTRALAKTLTTTSFVTKSVEVHGDKYDYSKVVYVSNITPVTIVCKYHGEFNQSPSVHWIGCGCPKCGDESTSSILSSNTNEFTIKATGLHKGLYTYENTVYVNSSTKVSITCPVHGEFLQTPSGHLQGLGCRECSPGGFDPNKPGVLYYLKVTKPHCSVQYKIGITNKSVEQRFDRDDLSYITVLWTKLFSIGGDCYKEEQRILKKYKEFKYTGPNVLRSGNTELFTKDIFPSSYLKRTLLLQE